jgi:hypothetical protein
LPDALSKSIRSPLQAARVSDCEGDGTQDGDDVDDCSDQARALVREARAERPLSLPWVDAVVDAYVWRFGPGATAARRRELLIALQELAGQLDPLQFEILKGRIAVF